MILDARSKTVNMRQSLLIFAWAATLLVSALPDILLTELQITLPIPILWARVALLAVFIAAGSVWSIALPLRPYFVLFMVLYLADALFYWIGTTAVWQGGFSGASFSSRMFGEQLLRLGTAFAMIAALRLMFRRQSGFFLTPGEIDATAEPVRWIGMDRPLKWTRFGIILTVCITGGTLAFLLLSGSPSPDLLAQVVALIPAILLIAAMNAFSEEVTYRAALLAPLQDIVGKTHALLLTVALFGLWHYYGVPYGVIGVAMAGVLGWLLGKSMLETRGMFWAWFIHFWQDVAIFTFIAAGSITPGG